MLFRSDPEEWTEDTRDEHEAIMASYVAPEPHLLWIWRCWHELSSDRTFTTEGLGGGLGPIRIFSRPQPIGWSRVIAWASYNAVEAREDISDLFACVRAMDRVYLDHVASRLEVDLKKMMK